jgi:replicative DNA helicase
MKYRRLSEVWVDAAQELAFPPRGLPLPWWPTFTRYIGGLRPHELTLVCAPTGAGKTQLLANLAAQVAIQNHAAFAAPVETGDIDFAARVISCIEGRDLNTGDPVSPETLKRITEKHADTVITRDLFIASYDNRVEIEEMVNVLKYMNQEYGVKVAILDNLNFFLKVVSSQMEKAEMDNAIHEFVILAKKLPMHVILIVHPKKTQDGRVESEFDIKGSSTAVQEASNVILFNRPTKQDVADGKRDITERELVFRKIRKRGINVGRPIWFGFDQGKYREQVNEGY